MKLPNFHLIKRTITSVDSPDPYLMRWEFNLPWFTLKLHRFLRSDQAPLHDHPWWFLSFVLWGGYEEYLARFPGDMSHPTRLRRWPFSVAFRRATDRHRVDIGDRKYVWTFCLTGPKRRSWYFYPVNPHARGAFPEDLTVRVPWRVAVAYGENRIQEMVQEGRREPFFEALNLGLLRVERLKEAYPDKDVTPCLMCGRAEAEHADLQYCPSIFDGDDEA